MIKNQRFTDLMRRWSQDRSGAAAVEFAMIATPLFTLILATLEVALFFVGSTIIENGVSETSRTIRTGQVQASGQTIEDFRSSICDRIQVVADCGRLYLDVRTIERFADSDFSSPLDADGEMDDSGFVFDPGGASEIVIVRAFYDWPLFMPGAVSGLPNMAGNRRLISATAVFRNEPFE